MVNSSTRNVLKEEFSLKHCLYYQVSRTAGLTLENNWDPGGCATVVAFIQGENAGEMLSLRV